jgi:hypothetical protein
MVLCLVSSKPVAVHGPLLLLMHRREYAALLVLLGLGLLEAGTKLESLELKPPVSVCPGLDLAQRLLSPSVGGVLHTPVRNAWRHPVVALAAAPNGTAHHHGGGEPMVVTPVVFVKIGVDLYIKCIGAGCVRTAGRRCELDISIQLE